MNDALDIRMRAIQFVLALRQRWVGIPSAELRNFYVGNTRIPLSAQQGIFKPAALSEPLSIRSALNSPYADPIDGSRVRYAFAPPSREYDNDALKRCAEKHLPLIYLLQTKPKPDTEYIAFAPVYVTGWNDSAREFLIDLSEQSAKESESLWSTVPIKDSPLAKRYVLTSVERRLHQARFRNAVLAAYHSRCAVCVLKIRPLLDGAHLRADRDPTPNISINEGMALCAIHHRAFDAGVLRYDSTYRVRIELPANMTPGEGEQAMLLDYHGRALRLPPNESYRPILLS